MRRREFIALVGSGVASLPLATRAQQPDQVRRIGILSGFADEQMRPLLTAFQKRLHENGWTDGRNIIVDARLTAGDTARFNAESASLVASGASVIVAQGVPGVMAVQQHSRSVPIVFTLVGDPVGLGLVGSWATPGGQATGFTHFESSIGGKWLELLKEIDHRVGRVAVIQNAGNPGSAHFIPSIEAAARSLLVDVSTSPVRNADDIEKAIAAIAGAGGGLIVLPDSLAATHRHLVVELAARHGLPAVYPSSAFTTGGGLISYGIDFMEMYRQAASYVARILRGAKPADLPVQAPTKFEMVINVTTAKSLGIAVPQTLLGRADEVME
jgi:putative tryptophan/tyrosine transport system substrate-binding protein